MINEFLKLIHIVGAVIFLGNITTTLVWKVYTEKSRDPQIISHMLRLALHTDKIITIPGVLIITFTGILLAATTPDEILSKFWLVISVLMWIISSFVAILYLVPSLKRLSFLADALASEVEMSDDYLAKARHWNLGSFLLIMSPMVILVLMVLKP